MGTVEPAVERQVAATAAQAPVTDGFQLVIDALKLNGLDTIYGLPGIPITDLTRRAQAAGLRVLSFRHEQNAGYAASIAGFLTQKPGICLTVSAPGFLNGLNALAHATVNCFPMILISGVDALPWNRFQGAAPDVADGHRAIKPRAWSADLGSGTRTVDPARRHV